MSLFNKDGIADMRQPKVTMPFNVTIQITARVDAPDGTVATQFILDRLSINSMINGAVKIQGFAHPAPVDVKPGRPS